jgi:glycogen(starch) synthase
MSDEKCDVRNPILFDCAWEAANKVSSIVIKTKVPIITLTSGRATRGI